MSVDAKVSTVESPESIVAANKIINAVSRGDIITIHASCSVLYEGRAESTIAEGDRVVMIKPDGTVLVHGDEGYQPINWQASGSDVKAEIDGDGNLLIIGVDSEYLEVNCYAVYTVTLFDNTDKAELHVRGTEAEMHERILDDPQLVESGFHDLEHEKKFPFGRVDVFGYDSDGVPVIVEVKRRSANRDHVHQLYTYLKEYKERYSEDVRGVLVAPDCTDFIAEVLNAYDLGFVPLDPLDS